MSQNFWYPSDALTTGTVNVNVVSSVLPTNAAQESGGNLESIDNKTPAQGQATMANSSPVVIASDQSPVSVSGPLTDVELRATPVDVLGPLTDAELRASAVPISAASLPLPAGAATSANQSTEIASLASIDSKIVAVDTGNVTVVASALPAGASTSALQTTGNSSLSSIDGKLNSLGQKTMAASVPVVIASDQSTVPVSMATSPLPTGAATEATLLAFSNKTAGALVSEDHDYLDITYVGATTDINTVVYKTGGAGGTTVATLTMGYDGSNRLTSVTKT